MHWLKTIFREIVGLFVDDGSFALAILLWLGILWLIFPRLNLPSEWKCLILLAGLVLILVESTTRYARKSIARRRP